MCPICVPQSFFFLLFSLFVFFFFIPQFAKLKGNSKSANYFNCAMNLLFEYRRTKQKTKQDENTNGRNNFNSNFTNIINITRGECGIFLQICLFLFALAAVHVVVTACKYSIYHIPHQVCNVCYGRPLIWTSILICFRSFLETKVEIVIEIA